MFAEGRGSEALGQVMVLMASLERENERLAWRVLRANRYRFGRSTEKLSRDELKQLFLALGGQDAAVAGDGSAELAVPAPDEPDQADSAPPDAEAAGSGEAGDADNASDVKRKRNVCAR